MHWAELRQYKTLLHFSSPFLRYAVMALWLLLASQRSTKAIVNRISNHL